MIWLELLFTTLFVFVHSTEAQLSTNEIMKNKSHCNLNIDMNLDCGTDAVIAVHTLQYAYNVTCETTCCQYSSYHCFVDAEINDIKDARRMCSGKNSCPVSINTKTTDFKTCSLGVKPVLYVFIQYYCIAESRIRSICSSGPPISPTNQPLYLTNEGYPGVTTGVMTCSCSLEIFSCSSKINLYTVDADLYLDKNNCEQKITFSGQDNQTLKTIACDDYYGNQIAKTLLDSHYAKIEFNSNSTQNLQGYFFIGFDSSEQDVSYQLTCSSQPNTWCTECGSVSTVINGNITLTKEGDDSFGATANVACDTGYKTDTPTISCQGNGTWPTPECSEKPACTTGQWRCDDGDCISDASKCDNVPDCPDESDEQKCTTPLCPEGQQACTHFNGSNVCINAGSSCDCGSVPTIDNGAIVLNDNSTVGAVADVMCNKGYTPSNSTVTCLITGSWETALCSPIDCGSLPSLSYGHYELVNAVNTVFGASAKVLCDSGYTTRKSTIICQSSGVWETAVCSKRAKPGPSPKDSSDDNNNIIIIIVVVIVIVILVQLVIMCYLQCKIHNIRKTATDGDTEVHKRILMTILGSIPLVGIIPIYKTWKEFYRDVYRVSHPKHSNDIDTKSQNGFSNHIYGSHEPVIQATPGEHDRAFPDDKNPETELSDVGLEHKTPEPTQDQESEPHEIISENKNTEISEVNEVIESESATSAQTIICYNPSDHDGEQIEVHQGGTMTRGISAAVFPDKKDDMPLGSSQNILPYKPKPHVKPHVKSHVKPHDKTEHDDHRHHHFSKETEEKRVHLKKVMEEARRQGHHAEIHQDQLFLGNVLYRGDKATTQGNGQQRTLHDTEGHHKRTHDQITHHKHKNGVEFY